MPRRVYLLGVGLALVALALAFTDWALSLRPGVTESGPRPPAGREAHRHPSSRTSRGGTPRRRSRSARRGQEVRVPPSLPRCRPITGVAGGGTRGSVLPKPAKAT